LVRDPVVLKARQGTNADGDPAADGKIFRNSWSLQQERA
jgi:hypothetical protein